MALKRRRTTLEKIKVAIVEDDVQWLKIMTSFISKNDDMELVGSATTKEEAINMAKSVRMDVILMDINLHGNDCDGIYAAADILEFKKVKVIMITSLNDEDIIRDAFVSGAVSYIKKENFEDLTTHIRRCMDDTNPIGVLLKEFKKMSREMNLKDLSPSERQIFEYLEQGYSHKKIEYESLKSPNTIKAQIRSILQKLQVKSSKSAVRKVKRGGLL